ncbi:MAG: hypothetical protein MSS69_07975 [Spirochaetales bacterium]|nr:hypothetical protein [Spirochaetales bacterium]
MVSKKYTSDYRLENVEGKNGKVVTKPVYRGDLFGFSKSEKKIKRLKTIFIITTIIQWCLYLASVLINTRAGRTMYVSLPFLAIAFPLLGQSDAVWTFVSTKGDATRMVKDKITEKLISWIFMVLFFAFCSIIGHVVFWIRNGETIIDAVFLVLTVLLVFSSWNLFTKRKDLEMKKTGTTVIPEKDD